MEAGDVDMWVGIAIADVSSWMLAFFESWERSSLAKVATHIPAPEPTSPALAPWPSLGKCM